MRSFPQRSCACCTAGFVLAVLITGCQPAAPGDGGDTSGGGNGSGDAVQGTWSATSGLLLESNGASLSVGESAAPSNTTLTLRRLTDADLSTEGLPTGQGFEPGVEKRGTGT